MTPISAHSLTSRPLVFPAGISLQIECEDDSVSADVSTDGREAFATTPSISFGNFCFP